MNSKEDSLLYNNEKLIYLIKYENQNIEEEEIIYIILEKIETISLFEIEEIIKNRQVIYLLESDKDIRQIEKDKNIYITKDEIEDYIKPETTIYKEIQYSFKYDNYKKYIYLESKEIHKQKENIIYLIKYDKNKQNINEENLVYIILKDEMKVKEELALNELKEIIKNKQIIYLLKNEKKIDSFEKESHIYTIKEDKLKENIENEESIFYIEIKFDEVKYKKYKKTIYLESRKFKHKLENEKIIYLEKYKENEQNIKEEKIIYIILEYEDKLIIEDKKVEEIKEINKSFKEVNKEINNTAKYKNIYRHPPNITYFRFFNSRHIHLSSFNIPSIIQRERNSPEQIIFFNAMHKRYAAYRLFYLYYKHTDKRKKCLNIWLNHINNK